MRIGIDAHFLSKISQGTGTYSYQLISSLINCIGNEKLVLLNKDNILDKWNNAACLEWGKLISNYTPFNIMMGYDYIALKKKLDIVHSNYLCSILPTKMRKVITVHDILFKSNPQYFPQKLRNGIGLFSLNSFKQADRIIAVSEFTKEQLIHYYPFVKEKVYVVYEAASADYYPLADVEKEESKKQLNIQKPYILFVGRFAPMKNIETLISFFLKNKQIQKEYDLFLVGKFDKAFPNKKLETQIYSSSKIRIFNNISNKTLNLLYNNASLFYFVSHGEGFGLPILEAMSTGCPVLTSNTTACNEIAGNAAIKVSPTSALEIGNAIETILADTNLQQQLAKEGIKQAQKYSWNKCAEETLDVYKSLS